MKTQTIEQMKPDTHYNSWSSYETWLLNLWLTNEQGTSEYWQESAQTAFDGAREDCGLTKLENAALALADTLKDQWETDVAEQISRNNGFVTDLVNSALSEVNWMEIANSLLDDVDKD